VNQPEQVDHTFDPESRLATTNDNFLGSVSHYYTLFMDRFKKVSVCNSRKTLYYYTPTSAGGTSHEPNVINAFNSCGSEYPRLLQSYIYLESRPVAVAQSEIASSLSDAQSNDITYYILNDQLGTPIMVTEADRDKRWQWENDPFGREKPIEYGVSTTDVSPDDDTASPYKTCCCTGCGGGCGTCTTGCSAGQCTGGTSQAVVWTKTYTPGSAINVRVHFSAFNVTAGSSRTGKDYVTLYKGDGTTVVSVLTGNLGAHWSPWSNDSGMVVKLTSDYAADQSTGQVTIDSLEYTTNNGRFIMHLRMPGQIYDEDVLANYNWNRWYRPEDGRYLSPDPIGLAGGESGYFAYANSTPQSRVDPRGLDGASPGTTIWFEGDDGGGVDETIVIPGRLAPSGAAGRSSSLNAGDTQYGNGQYPYTDADGATHLGPFYGNYGDGVDEDDIFSDCIYGDASAAGCLRGVKTQWVSYCYPDGSRITGYCGLVDGVFRIEYIHTPRGVVTSGPDWWSHAQDGPMDEIEEAPSGRDRN
jgi:RHS repeat-associated protein